MMQKRNNVELNKNFPTESKDIASELENLTINHNNRQTFGAIKTTILTVSTEKIVIFTE